MAKTPTPCEQFLNHLLHSWDGAGRGSYPTMNDFQFEVNHRFHRVPVQTKAFFVHSSLGSWPVGKRSERGMHFENGFLRCTGERQIEWSLTHNFGATEVVKGEVDKNGVSAVLTTGKGDGKHSMLGNANTVLQTKRELTVVPSRGELDERFYMATTDVPELTLHLHMKYKQG